MTINRDGRDIELECDSCPTTTEVFDTNDFEIMIAAAKSDGWEIAPSPEARGGYSHLCPSCQGGSRVQRAKDLFGF